MENSPFFFGFRTIPADRRSMETLQDGRDGAAPVLLVLPNADSRLRYPISVEL